MPLASSRNPWQSLQEHSSDIQAEHGQSRVRNYGDDSLSAERQRQRREGTGSGYNMNRQQLEDVYKSNQFSSPAMDQNRETFGVLPNRDTYESLQATRPTAQQFQDKPSARDDTWRNEDEARLGQERRHGGLRGFASQKWNELTHEQTPRHVGEDNERAFRQRDSQDRQFSDREAKKGMWERVKDKGEELKDDAKDWVDDHWKRQRKDAHSGTKPIFTEKDRLDTHPVWRGDNPEEIGQLRGNQGFADIRDRDDRTISEARDIRRDAREIPSEPEVRGADNRGVWSRLRDHDDQWQFTGRGTTVTRSPEDRGVWNRLRDHDEQWRFTTRPGEAPTRVIPPNDNVEKVDELLRGAPYQRASLQPAIDTWWKGQQEKGEQWEGLKRSGAMFKEPEFKRHPAFLRLPERVDPTTERASSAEEALTDHTDAFVEDGFIGLHEIEAAEILADRNQGSVRNFLSGKWHELTHADTRKIDDNDQDRRVQEWRDRTFQRGPALSQLQLRAREREREWAEQGKSTVSSSFTPTQDEAKPDFMTEDEYRSWNRYRIRLADAMTDRSQQVERD